MNTSDAVAKLRAEIARRRQLADGLAALVDEVFGPDVVVRVLPPLGLPGHVPDECVEDPLPVGRAPRLGPHRGRQGRVVKPRRRPRIAPGTIPDRLLSLLAEVGGPQRFDALVEGAKARPSHVRAALLDLLAARRVVKVGGGRWTQYARPEHAKAQ